MSGKLIVVRTAEGSGELVERAKKARVKGWLVKLFKPARLVVMVTKLVS